ncbi:MAG: hypothetical protein HeimAB125_07170 [Candidatus Heimdallarchaeota archaeon AB_125]|nr:MAG: hypothetical protein HeimAB125_07170 [Candidatus Heimdallarchaeota archaeon AB_125]
MTEEERKEKEEPLKLRNRFRIQVKKYWKYTRKWFPFALLIGGISGVLMALFTSLVVNMQSWLSNVPIYIKYLIVGGITSIFLFFGFKEVYGAGLSHVLSHKNTSTPLRARGILTKFITSTFRVECLPVVDRADQKTIMGLISFRDIETRYESELTKIHSKRSLTIEELDSEEEDINDL